MNWRAGLAATLLSLAVISVATPSASAQDVTGVAFTVDQPEGMIPHNDSLALSYSFRIGCLEILQAAGEEGIAITHDAPAWLTVSGDTTPTLDYTTCPAGTGATTVTGNLSLTPSTTAPGRQPVNITFTADYQGKTDASTITAEVEYRPGYEASWTTDLPVKVEGETAEFEYVMTITANAQTMVMFEVLGASQGGADTRGSINIPNLVNFFPADMDVENGSTQKTINIIYRAPTSDWDNDTVVFKTWSHWLLDGAFESEEQIITWTFQNHHEGHGEHDDEHEHDDAKKEDKFLGIPGPHPVLVLGLLAAAVGLARRHRQ